MEPKAYRQMAANEETHWWFCGRRATVTNAIEHHILPLHRPNSSLSILEVGCGVGGNLALLSAYGNVEAIEHDTWAVETARKKALATVHQGSLPEAIPKDLGTRYDLIALLDVLELASGRASADLAAEATARASAFACARWRTVGTTRDGGR